MFYIWTSVCVLCTTNAGPNILFQIFLSKRAGKRKKKQKNWWKTGVLKSHQIIGHMFYSQKNNNKSMPFDQLISACTVHYLTYTTFYISSTLSEQSLKSRGRGFPLNSATSFKIFSASSNRSWVKSHLRKKWKINSRIKWRFQLNLKQRAVFVLKGSDGKY